VILVLKAIELLAKLTGVLQPERLEADHKSESSLRQPR
jgi:hypothetical protein